MASRLNFPSMSTDPYGSLRNLAIQGIEQERSRELSQHKFAISQLTDSYHQAKSPALKMAVQGVMEDYMSVLPQTLRRALSPYLQNSPVSELEFKRREFLKLYPAPESPSSTARLTAEAGSGEQRIEQDPVSFQEMSSYLFAKADHERMMQRFLFGKDPGEKRLLPYGNGHIYRSPEGAVTFLDPRTFDAAARAELFGVTPAQYLADQGKLYSEEVMTVSDGQKLEKRKNFYDDLTGKTGFIITDVEKHPLADESVTTASVPLGLQNKVFDITRGAKPYEDDYDLLNGSDGDRQKLLKRLQDAHSSEALFAFSKLEEGGIAGFFSSWGDEWGITVIPRQAVQVENIGGKDFFTTKDGQYVINGRGEIAPYEAVTAEIAQGTSGAEAPPPARTKLTPEPQRRRKQTLRALEAAASAKGPWATVSAADMAEAYKDAPGLKEFLAWYDAMSSRNIHIENEDKATLIKEFIKLSMTPPPSPMKETK